MYYKIKETDEALFDLGIISINNSEYIGSKRAGEDFLTSYDKKVNTLNTFPEGFREISIKYRGYDIRVYPFKNYNIFFIVRDKLKDVVVLRVLYQSQDWNRILNIENIYHIRGRTV